ncbi:hypothetical protein Hypma_013897 [Hypsizygus marmoreus]|uniref:DUF6533 domain-containing protein n=1 Tax=Hypsizygus marmoreus TaxID=39966 RepID=A0A369KFZ9_HYPMA|nr:hypothetical protein Hypma_013897 [Hypsizygus marmoreus]
MSPITRGIKWMSYSSLTYILAGKLLTLRSLNFMANRIHVDVLAVARDLIVNSVTFSGFTILLYDHILTIGDEINLVWRKPKNIVSCMFLLNRYLALSIVTVGLYDKLYSGEHSRMFCNVWILLQGYLTIICYISLHAVIAIRVNAIHGGIAKIRNLLWTGGIVYTVSIFVFQTATYPMLVAQLNPNVGACIMSIPPYLWISWIPTLLFEAVLFVTTVHFAWSRFSCSTDYGAFYASLFHDGAIYFLVVSLCSLASLIVWARVPPTLIGFARPLSLCLITTSGSRLILKLKLRVYGQSHQPITEEKSSAQTSPEFEFKTHARSVNSLWDNPSNREIPLPA